MKVAIFNEKGTFLHESTSFEPFCVIIQFGGLTSRAVVEKT